MKNFYFLTSILFSLCLIHNDLDAQSRFQAGAVLGINAAQIDGDSSAGFNKLGLTGGLRAVAKFTEKIELGIELMYSQRGSQTELGNGNTALQRKIHLDYAEIPVTFNYKDWISNDETYYRLDFLAGLSYGRLINIKLLDEEYDVLGEFFSKNDYSVIVGFNYNINEHLGLGVRYNRSINLLINNDKVPQYNFRSLVGYFLQFRSQYMF